MAGTCAGGPSPATGNLTGNSGPAEDLRRDLQVALPYGGAQRMARRLGRDPRWVYDQIEGRTPLTVTVLGEALVEAPGPTLAAVSAFLAPAGFRVSTTSERLRASVAALRGAADSLLSVLSSDFPAEAGE